MAHLESIDFKVSFDLPDRPKARQVLEFDSIAIFERDTPALVQLWECAKTVISEWQCEFIPDISMSIDELEGIEAVHAIEWASTQARAWRTALNKVPKN